MSNRNPRPDPLAPAKPKRAVDPNALAQEVSLVEKLIGWKQMTWPQRIAGAANAAGVLGLIIYEAVR